ncbi:MED7 protein-domain-containing protein [Vararia minispora EC-137]|uniref:MED7 protein-domain-containing protein n=1 Tax=Vararia minispora EC-137 TaxID=1314806 RepID=A0ACB8QRF1_9AGAM|nr:MED7 protein-domain-containing protein [Vararia minispora EC-137]
MEEAELRNPFPAPPSLYTRYTSQNLKYLALLRERTAENEHGPDDPEKQREVLADMPDVPDWPLAELEKPRADWIVEEGYYKVYGETWFLKETLPSLAENGIEQLYPADRTVDRKPILLSILKSMLVAYSTLLKSLLLPPPSNPVIDPQTGQPLPPEWDRQVHWIQTLAQNILAAANELRPVQARVNVEMLLKRQLDFRRAETRAIHEQCDSLEAQLAELRSLAKQSAESNGESEKARQTAAAVTSSLSVQLTADDVLRWAEEV